MARKVVHLTVTTEDSRDKGGVIELREMSAYDATELCLRMFQCIARGGIDIPPEIFSMGPQGVVVLGAGAVLAGLGKTPWYDIKPLLDALLACVQSYQPPGAVMPTRGLD